MGRGLKLALIGCLALSGVTGCGFKAYRYEFHTGLAPSETRVTEVQHQALYGWISNNVFDLEQACPAGTSEFGSYISVGNWLPALFTAGLYTPRTAYAICANNAEEPGP